MTIDLNFTDFLVFAPILYPVVTSEVVYVTKWEGRTTIICRCSAVICKWEDFCGWQCIVCHILWGALSHKERINLPQMTSICLQWQHEEGPSLFTAQVNPHKTIKSLTEIWDWWKLPKVWNNDHIDPCLSAYTDHVSEGEYFIIFSAEYSLKGISPPKNRQTGRERE